ncbi:MAG: lysylphosphatidylglycerol synthase transmembrane domain-containing protein [Bacilli bacterium]
MNEKLKKVANIIVLALVTCLVLYFSLKDNFNTIINEIINVNIFWLVISFLLAISFWFFKAIATTRIANIFKKDYSIKQGMRLVLETNFFHAITPFAVGGQPYEIYSLKKSKLKITEATNVSIVNFIVYQIALVLLGIIAIVYNHHFVLLKENDLLKNLVVIGFLVNFIVIVALFLLTCTKKINKILMKFIIKVLNKIHLVKNKDEKIKQFNEYLNEFHQGAKILLQDKKLFIKLIFVHFIGLISSYLIPLTLAYAMGISSYTGIEAIVLSSYVMLIGAFVPIPGGTGGLEYGFMTFYGSFIKGSKLNAIMLLWRFITYYFAMILGAILLGIRKKEK